MRLMKKGQSALEYILLATIILAGIAIGGPMLLKGVQGYFKLTEESVKDATSEKIEQDSTLDPSLTPKSCKCSANPVTLPDQTTHYNDWKKAIINTWTKGDCGADKNKPTMRYYYRTCTPLKCAQEEAWIPDETCCTEAKPVGCGTKILAATGIAPSAANLCNPVRSAVDARFNGEFANPIGTCTQTQAGLGTYDTKDCAIGERIYSKQCANALHPSTPDTIYGCKHDGFGGETEQNCLPSCWQYPYPHSKPCTIISNSTTLEDDTHNVNENAMSLENDDSLSIPQRWQLVKEVIYRQSAANAGDNPPNMATLPPTPANMDLLQAHRVIAMQANHNPYRVLTKYVETGIQEKINAYRNHYVYLKNYGATGQCSPDRYCERTCPGGYSPNVEGANGLHENESCTQNACWYGWWPDTTNKNWTSTWTVVQGDKLCDSQEDPAICPPNPTTDVCGYIGICFSKDGTICYQATSDNVPPIRQLDKPFYDCMDDEHKITDRKGQIAYCYKILPMTDKIPMPAKFACNYKDLYFRVFGCGN
ncbi:MAG: hypothetical protein WCO69_03990 [Candidatus Omnitrophota bacterium]